MKDVAIIGGGIAGLATAARLQARGLSTVVFEAHGTPGGCAGYYRRRGFSFDVGATTLVDFEEGGVGGELLREIGMAPIEGEALPGYVTWLPDRVVTLYRNPQEWGRERLRALGDTPRHRRFWAFLDHLSAALWPASRRGVKLPLRTAADVAHAVQALGIGNLPLARYMFWTMGDLLRASGLRQDQALVGLLSMLIEDTVHGNVDDAPLMNAALGITIRGAGLTRATGGMRGFWRSFSSHYRSLGGELNLAHEVNECIHCKDYYRLTCSRGEWEARQVVSAVPIGITARIAPATVRTALQPYVRRDETAMGGAIVVCLGVSETEISGQPAASFTHHQLLQDYSGALGNGNNMFISVSAPGDIESAPPGHRALMISTHCDLEGWEGLEPAEYEERKRAAGDRLVSLARRVYPELGRSPAVYEVGTPRTYARFTRRPRGAVGGVRQCLGNSNQNAVPHDAGLRGFHLVGDTTWPGLGTVACVLGSKIVAGNVVREARNLAPCPGDRFPDLRSRGDCHA